MTISFRSLFLLPLLLLSLVSGWSQRPSLTPWLPATPATTAVIVCPGGSYFWLAGKTEGDSVAEALAREGFAAYVLRYRTGGFLPFITHSRLLVRGHRHPDPFDDLCHALADVRRQGYRRVGVVGFSAGGHLALSAALFSADSLRPDFVAACYPVVTMHAPYVHKRSRRGLLGDSRARSLTLRDSLSLERHVTSACPPVFLMNCLDDPIVDYHNAILMDSALTAARVPHVYRQYATGGHGFGTAAAKTSPEAATWFASFLEWLHRLTK